MSTLEKVAAPVGELNANAVFIHGLGGDPHGTWQCNATKESFWPQWLAEDIKGLTVWTVGYEASVSRWSGSAMHLTERSTNILARLLAEPELTQNPLILIGHSLGGLVIKQLLRTAESEAKNRQEAASFLDRIHKVAFLATPHSGSELATWGDRLRILIRPSAASTCLVRNDPNLRDLNVWYRDWANNRRISHLVLTETRSTSILGMIVKPDSSDPGLAGSRPVPVDGDHWQIAKPRDRASFTYDQVCAFIERRIERAQTPVETKLAELSEGQKAEREQTQKLIDLNERQLEVLQREKGIPREALIGHLVRIGAREDIGNEDIPKFLERFADEFPKLQQQLRAGTLDNPEISAVRQQAAKLLDGSDLEGAKAYLSQSRARISALQQQRSRDEAALLSDEARIDQLELHYRPAAEKFSQSATLVSFDAESAFAYLLEQSHMLHLQGEEFGDNQALAEAIAVLRRAAETRLRNVSALQWAMAQNNLGNALAILGERERGTARLEEAIAAYRKALEERTRERSPLQWAMTQNNLGNALASLGIRESGTTRLEEAVAAYGKALEERTRERGPLQWAMTQSNLGNALMRLGERDTGTARLEEAVAAYRKALTEYTRERIPLQWATVQNNLGNALAILGERERGTARLKEAVAAYRETLAEWTRERVPLQWAAVQNNLGNALARLGIRESGTTRLEEAVAVCRKALEEWTRERVPLDWATAQNNLGNALASLGERESGTARLEEAIAAYRKALEERTRERVPLDWATTIGNQGQAKVLLAERYGDIVQAQDGLSLITDAIEALRDGDHAINAGMFELELPRLRAILERLRN